MRWPVVPWRLGRSDLKARLHQLELSGRGSFRTDAEGRSFRSAEGSIDEARRVVREGHGGELALKEAHVDAISFGVSEADLDVQGIRGRLSGVLAIPGKTRQGARCSARYSERRACGEPKAAGRRDGYLAALKCRKLDASLTS